MKTILNDELISSIAELVSDGNYIKDAAVLSGICEGTFWNWMKTADNLLSDTVRSEDTYTELENLCIKLSKEMKIARAKNKDQHIQNINKAANGGVWQASAWYLERVYKNEFSLKSEVELSGSADITINIQGVNPERSDPE